jgi:hypothetical protein
VSCCNHIRACRNHTAYGNYTLLVDITLFVCKSHPACIKHTRSYRNQTRGCHIHTHTGQNYTRVCGNNTLRVEITLLRVEITLLRVEITLCVQNSHYVCNQNFTSFFSFFFLHQQFFRIFLFVKYTFFRLSGKLSWNRCNWASKNNHPNLWPMVTCLQFFDRISMELPRCGIQIVLMRLPSIIIIKNLCCVW